MIGHDCPECGKRLRKPNHCVCGWQATDDDADDSCAGCKAEKASRGKRRCVNLCRRCGAHSPSTTAFHEDGHSDDRNVRLCPGCWIPARKRRAALSQSVDCPVPACGLTVAEHIQEFKQYGAEIEARLMRGETPRAADDRRRTG